MPCVTFLPSSTTHMSPCPTGGEQLPYCQWFNIMARTGSSRHRPPHRGIPSWRHFSHRPSSRQDFRTLSPNGFPQAQTLPARVNSSFWAIVVAGRENGRSAYSVRAAMHRTSAAVPHPTVESTRFDSLTESHKVTKFCNPMYPRLHEIGRCFPHFFHLSAPDCRPDDIYLYI